jgi:hypothetical protein
MSKNITENNLVADAKSALKFWEQHPEINLNETTVAQFRKVQAAFQKLTDDIAQHEIELGAKMTERDQLSKNVRQAVSRLRSGVRAFFGPDSKEYEQIGGTRLSTRKRPVRRKNLEGVGAANGNGNGSANGNGNGQSEKNEEVHTA